MLRSTRLSAAVFHFVGLFGAAVLGLTFGGNFAQAIGLNYVDASSKDLFFPAAGENLEHFMSTPGSPIQAFSVPDAAGTGTDNLWAQRYNFGAGGVPTPTPAPPPSPDVPGVYETGTAAEDAPMLKMTVGGLTSGNQYDLYAVFWTDHDENWTLRAGTTSGNLQLFEYTDSVLRNPLAGATTAIRASAAFWDTLPPPTSEATTIFTQRPADPLFMLLAKVGTATANGSGEVEMFVDDLPFALGDGAGQRTWFDGLAYVAANTPVAITATINRDNGQLILSNPTPNPLAIKSYSITSAGGALNSLDWNPIDGSRDNGLGSPPFDSDNWTVTAPTPSGGEYETTLSEAETPAGNGGILTANGGALNLGNLWQQSPLQDVTINLTLSDNSVMTLEPTYTGDVIEQGDLDADGDIDVADFTILLNNIHSNVSTLTEVQARQLGDMTGNRAINFSDFVAFRTAYESAPGSGSFADLLAQVGGNVPEPGCLVMLLIAGSVLLCGSRRRVAGCALALMICCMATSTTSAQTLVAVDVNDRTEGEAVSPAGFSSFVLPTSPAAPSAAVVTVDGYTFDLSVFDSNGATGGVGAMDDRDRVVPASGNPAIDELYDDFIFVGGSAGPTGGLDLKISGGTLQPNTAYAINIYAYDGINATFSSGTPNRVADWFDANRGDVPLLSTNFTINQPPTTVDQYKFTGLAYTDNTGKLSVKGRRVTSADLAVYVDALSIEVPVGLLTVEVDRSTGDITILNEQSQSFNLSYYELRSAGGSLNSSWGSLDDAEGNPPGDPVGSGWNEVPNSTANLLSEVRLESTTTLDPTEFLTLTDAFAGGAEDLVFFYADAPGQTSLRPGIVKFVGVAPTLQGDYNNDGSVDAADYVVWRKTPGAFGGVPGGYNTWRQNFGEGGPGAGGAQGVPEPTAIVSVIVAVLGCCLARRRG